MTQTRNSKVLASFVRYCKQHPDERFWQALRNWSKYHLIYAVESVGPFGINERRYDTFNWEERRHDTDS